jgi:hypothetical protein
MIGLAKAASRERNAVKAIGEARREIVERVGGVAESGQEDDGRALAAEVERVKPNVAIHANHGRCVMRRVAPSVGTGARRLRGGITPRRARRAECRDDDSPCEIPNHGTVLLVDISFTRRYKNSSLS